MLDVRHIPGVAAVRSLPPAVPTARRKDDVPPVVLEPPRPAPVTEPTAIESRLRDLAVQSGGTGAASTSARAAAEREYAQLQQELNRLDEAARPDRQVLRLDAGTAADASGRSRASFLGAAGEAVQTQAHAAPERVLSLLRG